MVTTDDSNLTKRVCFPWCVHQSYNVACVVFVLYKGVVQPDELFVLSDHRELILLEVRERALCITERIYQ